ncbi:PQQ-binding-like beta-propeller repeat protein [Janthinobacterium lividum]|nr:PQQ-binding-like beta-propeller repeat protein [Janthinobacterium lividum]
MNAKQTITFAGVVYIKAVSDSAVIDPDIVVTPLADATVDVQVKTSSTAKPGHYTGNISVNVCTDVLCANHLAGSPFKLPYEIDVVSPDGGVTAINLSELSQVADAPDWETFQGNAQHTAYVPVTLTPSAFNARWKWFAPAVEGRQSQPSTLVTGGGMIFLSTGKWYSSTGASFVTAYSEKDGSKVWSHSFNDLNFPMAQPPAFSNGNVYVSAGGQESTAMFGFDATTGRQLFKSKMSAQWPTYLAPTIFNGSIYTNGGSYGGLYSFSPVMGALNFFTQLEQYDGWTPALDAKNLYAYMNGSLKLIDPATGVLRGEIIDPTYSWNGYTNSAAPVIGANGLVLSVNLTSQKKME